MSGAVFAAEPSSKAKRVAGDFFSPIPLLAEERVRERLQLSQGQRDAIDKILVARTEANEEVAQSAAADPDNSQSRQALFRKMAEYEKQIFEVLDPEQRTKLRRLHRIEYAYGMAPGNKVVRKDEEIHLTDEQKAALLKIDAEWRAVCDRLDEEQTEDLEKPLLRQLFFAEVSKQNRDFDSKLDERLEEILENHQWKRWVELRWQETAFLVGPSVLLREEIVRQARLSDEQQSRIQEINASTKEETDKMTKAGNTRAMIDSPVRGLRRAIATLPDEQRHIVESILGTPYGWFKTSWDRAAEPDEENK